MKEAPASQPAQKEIARGVVSIYKSYLGRGPTSAHTTITDDHVSTICTQGLTKAEQKLVDNGDLEMVRSIRRKFQEAMRDDIIGLVEQVTGRRARSLLSDHDVERDIAIETVILEPAGSGANPG
jgi:uncharacterized protein YbcI